MNVCGIVDDVVEGFFFSFIEWPWKRERSNQSGMNTQGKKHFKINQKK